MSNESDNIRQDMPAEALTQYSGSGSSEELRLKAAIDGVEFDEMLEEYCHKG